MDIFALFRKAYKNLKKRFSRTEKHKTDIYINITRVTSHPDFKPYGKTMSSQVYEDFVKFLVFMVREQVKDIITHQRFKKRWKPLSPAYLRWKVLKGYDTRTWIRTGKLLKAIKAWYNPSRKLWIIGVSPYTVYDDTGLAVLDVARWMEHGTSRMPARPVFGPVFSNIEKNIGDFWNLYEKAVRSGKKKTWRTLKAR